MTTQYEGIKQVVHISTSETKACKDCATWTNCEDLGEMISHYVKDHGYRLLHVGTETSNDRKGNPCHSTVAVLGK